MLESKNADEIPEFETITITVPKNAKAVSTTTIYEEYGVLKMFVRTFDTADLKSLKGADNIGL